MEERKAMDYFLNCVLTSFDSNLTKKWVHGTSTHQLLLGDAYVYDVAFALNLTSKFSDPGNVLYNAGLKLTRVESPFHLLTPPNHP
jgi:hypothetical protein